MIPVLTLDGPSGTGKGTVGMRVAMARGWHFLDSGALYRALAFRAAALDITESDVAELYNLAVNLDVAFPVSPEGAVRVMVEETDVTDTIRSEQGGELASRYASIPEVRAGLLERQRSAKRLPGLVADGRDMGTRVFPDALLKVFLTARPEVRALRRYKQLKEKGFSDTLRRLETEISKRDLRDTQRKHSPLGPAGDAIVIDTSEMSVEEVSGRVASLLNQRLSSVDIDEGVDED